jgi:hypothetical protein
MILQFCRQIADFSVPRSVKYVTVTRHGNAAGTESKRARQIRTAVQTLEF